MGKEERVDWEKLGEKKKESIGKRRRSRLGKAMGKEERVDWEKLGEKKKESIGKRRTS